MVKRWIASLMVVPIVALAGCAETGDDAEIESDTMPAADTALGAGDQTMAPAGGTRFQMTAKNNSGITGAVRLAGAADSIAVRVELQGVQAGTQYASHIHGGNCTQPGDVVVPLNAVPGGEGMAETRVSPGQLQTGQSYLVMSHGSGGQPVACGNFPQNWRSQVAPGGGGMGAGADTATD